MSPPDTWEIEPLISVVPEPETATPPVPVEPMMVFGPISSVPELLIVKLLPEGNNRLPEATGARFICCTADIGDELPIVFTLKV
jgi:hypothetical protein